MAKPRFSDKVSMGNPLARPPPTAGWNTRDNVAELNQDEAVILDNFFPGFGSVWLRNGFTEHATGLGGVVEYLGEFNAGSARHLLAAANGNVWNVTASGAGVSLGSGFLSNRWISAQFDDFGGGARLGMVAKTNTPQIYNGTTLSAMTLTGPGLTATNIGGINVFKSRTYFWDPATQDFWYSAVGALGGAVTRFPLGRVQGTGGNMVAMGTWSRDGGAGPDDLAVFLLSSGDVLVYAGSNPGDPADWAIIGVYNIGVPITQRGVKKVGSDLLILTKSGYVPLSTVLSLSRFGEQAFTISSKIRGAALAAIRESAGVFGWDILYYPKNSMLIVNVPISAVETIQHVMNVETGAWCRFRGINAYAWSLLAEDAYFGGPDGNVYRFDNGLNDNGASIQFNAQQAWDYLGSKRRSKRVSAVRPIFKTSGTSTEVAIGLGFDYEEVRRRGTILTVSPSAGSPWDTSDWDVAEWGDDSAITRVWASVGGEGYAVSLGLAGEAIDQTMEWLTTHYVFENGGAL